MYSPRHDIIASKRPFSLRYQYAAGRFDGRKLKRDDARFARWHISPQLGEERCYRLYGQQHLLLSGVPPPRFTYMAYHDMMLFFRPAMPQVAITLFSIISTHAGH